MFNILAQHIWRRPSRPCRLVSGSHEEIHHNSTFTSPIGLEKHSNYILRIDLYRMLMW
jgi:hypothetical protein